MRNKLKGIYEVLLIAIGLAIIICFIFINRRKNNARTTRMSCRTFFTLAGIRLEQLGEFDESADLIIMNHQSVADILCLEAYHPRNICWVAKKQLGEIPFYGYALTGPEMILIDREDKRGLAMLLSMVKDKLSQKRPIVIFPEGTRSKGRERFLPFKPGAKLIAEKFQLKIQPIVLVNTRRIFNSSPIEATSNVARMIMLKPFSIGGESGDRGRGDSSQNLPSHNMRAQNLPSKEIFYKNQESFIAAQAQAKKHAKKPCGLATIIDLTPESSKSLALESRENVAPNAESSSPTSSWYEQLEQCMQETYTYHYNKLNQQ